MPRLFERKWRPGRWWEARIANRLSRFLRKTGRSPEAELEMWQSALRFHLRKGGPDSSATAAAMIAVADQLRQRERYAEELLLRRQIVEAVRRNLGLEHENTLEAEAHLGAVLLDLDRGVEAEPLLAHVVNETKHSPAEMSHETYNAILRLALVYENSNRLDEARELLEEALTELALHDQAATAGADYATIFLGAVLLKLNDSDGALPVYRQIVDTQVRTLGSDHPETLESLETLIHILIRTDHLSEASVMAASLVERRTRMFGEGDAGTTSARKLLASLAPPDATSPD